MGLYETDTSPEETMKLVKDWSDTFELADEDDQVMDFDEWVRNHPKCTVKCVQLSFDPVDVQTGEYLNEISLP